MRASRGEWRRGALRVRLCRTPFPPTFTPWYACGVDGRNDNLHGNSRGPQAVTRRPECWNVVCSMWIGNSIFQNSNLLLIANQVSNLHMPYRQPVTVVLFD